MDPFETPTPLKNTSFIFQFVILTVRSLSHEKPFQIVTLVFMFFMANHTIHYQQKTLTLPTFIFSTNPTCSTP